VFEAAIQAADALEAADRGVLFKTSVKEIGQRFQVMPTFMAKWNSALPGCSGHMHQSLWTKNGNAFDDDKDPRRMSKVFKSYLAGQLRGLADLLPFFAPTVNSYKRLVDGYWAPTKVTWGMDNRTVALRVIPGGPKSTRVEVRVSGSDINPYLALAASIGAGLWGIAQELKLEDAPVEGSAYMVEKAVRLPRTLQEATRRLSESKLAREILGDFFRGFVDSLLSEDCKGCFMANTATELAGQDEAVARVCFAHARQFEATLSGLLVRAQQAGEISSQRSPLQLARFLQNTMNGLAVTAKATRDRKVLSDVVEVALATLDR
jgi:glutamine synthetase